jgi:Fic family protein
MATPSEKLAESLEFLHKLQETGSIAIRASDLTRTHRERLIKNKFIREVMKGWYIPTKADELAGESTSWYASFWNFCASYLNDRFGNEWSLSAEQSILLHAGNWTVPKQLIVRTPKGNNNLIELLHDTSLFDLKLEVPDEKNIEIKNKLRIYTLPLSLIHCSPNTFIQNAIDVRAVLSAVSDSSDVLAGLLDGGHTKIAGRLAGAFRNIGREKIADDIVKTMISADYHVREVDPFNEKTLVVFASRELSPYVNRIRIMWQEMREEIEHAFPHQEEKRTEMKVSSYLEDIDRQYVTDAYHSLSIEGYKVSRKLIEKVREGNWQPDTNQEDRELHNALAAKGYWQAFQTVKLSIKKVLDGMNPGEVLENDHADWYREMFSPGITAGILKTSDLAGYRNDQVFIRHSHHVPPNYEAVRDLIPAYFELLKNEKSSCARIVLGHYVFVYIHPYFDGNGRMGRFIMNLMRAASGLPWLIIPVEEREKYMSSLEEASGDGNIIKFAKYLLDKG